MKMIFSSFKSLSRSVHQEHEEAETKTDGTISSLTVWRKSLILSCKGFTVINSNGDLIYRVDSYAGRPEELLLMDGLGKSVLTVRRRKKLGVLLDSWFVYEGGDTGHCCATNQVSSNPTWHVTKHNNLLKPNQKALAHVFRGRSERGHCYVIEGSYTHRSCKILDGSRKEVAEIKRKEASINGVSFGLEVFLLVLEPCFDPGFAMALVLILDQMFS
ncbi:hypothetical protein K2173_010406 [Erythroxylum novogranatense]|uniref:Protein LURP-one-related 17 n=1 Tax=Erythroxylum novogranatense TaxID=1862640 RepID=A0AAV8TET3_9ROSI|nr:hypothetical protein K2173_010406 [Erythroxylum novogranatense]